MFRLVSLSVAQLVTCNTLFAQAKHVHDFVVVSKITQLWRKQKKNAGKRPRKWLFVLVRLRCLIEQGISGDHVFVVYLCVFLSCSMVWSLLIAFVSVLFLVQKILTLCFSFRQVSVRELEHKFLLSFKALTFPFYLVTWQVPFALYFIC
jgi:hypothetical protein